jgi:hypothetical protein
MLVVVAWALVGLRRKKMVTREERGLADRG